MKAVLGVLEAVQAVEQSLLELGYSLTLLPLTLPIEKARQELESLDTDLVFNLFEGFCGFPETEALVPETLSKMGIPFTGCQAAMLKLALNKAGVKVFLKAADIPTPDAQVLTPRTVRSFKMDYPCIVKPCSEDASHGLTGDSVVHDFEALKRQVKVISESYGGKALVERFIGGREFNATVMGKSRYEVLPISEIVYELPPEMPQILTFAAKWEPDSPYFDATKAVCPAEVDAEVRESVAGTALAVYRVLGCKGYARVDMRADSQGRINVIEVNPNPDISPGTGAARQAGAAGMTYAEFVAKIIEIALEKEANDNQHPADAKEGQAGPDANSAEYSRVQTG
jgi:D-alanine-D-alanine ligase